MEELVRRESFPKLKRGKHYYNGERSLYNCTMHSLKMEQLNERITNLDGIYVMSIVNIIRFTIFYLITKKLVDPSAKIQSLEKSNKADHRDVQIQTEKFDEEPISALYYRKRKKEPKVFR